MLEMTTVIVDDDERYKENHCSIIHWSEHLNHEIYLIFAIVIEDIL
jgi:hypothetical protein